MSYGKTARSAVYVQLAVTAAVTDIVGASIYHGRAPENETVPYVVIGDSFINRETAHKDSNVPSNVIRVHGHTSSLDPSQGEELRDEIFAALDRQNLTVTSGTFVDCFQSGLDTIALDEDENSYESVTEFLVRIDD